MVGGAGRKSLGPERTLSLLRVRPEGLTYTILVAHLWRFPGSDRHVRRALQNPQRSLCPLAGLKPGRYIRSGLGRGTRRYGGVRSFCCGCFARERALSRVDYIVVSAY